MSQEQPFLQQVRNIANVTLDVLLSGYSANINAAYQQANSSASTVTVNANDSLILANAILNFNNTASINVSVTANGTYETNVSFSTNSAVIQTQITAAYNAANTGISAAATALSVAEAAYATANVGVSVSGVTADSYGSGSQIPVFTVDSRGRITTISTVSYNLFTPTGAGIVKASGGGTTNFLRADGNWAAPAFVVAQSLGINGYRKYSDGYIEQWGRFTMSGGSTPVTFPIAFPTACFEVNLTAASVTGAEYTNGYPTSSGFTAVNDGNPVLMMWNARGN